jgi:hypothetical protein
MVIDAIRLLVVNLMGESCSRAGICYRAQPLLAYIYIMVVRTLRGVWTYIYRERAHATLYVLIVTVLLKLGVVIYPCEN